MAGRGADIQVPHPELDAMTIAALRAELDARRFSARELAAMYLDRITVLDRSGPGVTSVMEVNPDALAIAAELDRERATSGARGPLHGVPVLLKDNIDTADGMMTTAGSLALAGSRPRRDATVVARLRQAGAVILGKTTLSEWAGMRSTQVVNGWSARGGQSRNPYALDRTPGGSSSGSAAAVAATFAAAALGTETNGSILYPSAACSVVGIKPTVGLTSRAGIVPVARSQDSVGPHGRTVADAVLVLEAMTGIDPRDPATAASAGRAVTDYTRFLVPDGLDGARIGVPRHCFWGYSQAADAIAETALAVMESLGAEVVDPANVATAEALLAAPGRYEVPLYEFKPDLDAYLSERGDPAVGSLAELIRFNEEHADVEMRYFGQELFVMAQEKGPLTGTGYRDSIARSHRLARDEGIDAIMTRHRLDALVAPTMSPPWPIDLVNGEPFLGGCATPAARAGYPGITVPAGYAFGLPVGISFIGRAWSEPTLIRLAYAFEQATRVRRPPRYVPSTVVPTGAVSSVSPNGFKSRSTNF